MWHNVANKYIDNFLDPIARVCGRTNSVHESEANDDPDSMAGLTPPTKRATNRPNHEIPKKSHKERQHIEQQHTPEEHAS